MTLQEALKAYNKQVKWRNTSVRLFSDGRGEVLDRWGHDLFTFDSGGEAAAIQWLQDNTSKYPAEELIDWVSNTRDTSHVHSDWKHFVRKWFKENKGRTI